MHTNAYRPSVWCCWSNGIITWRTSLGDLPQLRLVCQVLTSCSRTPGTQAFHPATCGGVHDLSGPSPCSKQRTCAFDSVKYRCNISDQGLSTYFHRRFSRIFMAGVRLPGWRSCSVPWLEKFPRRQRQDWNHRIFHSSDKALWGRHCAAHRCAQGPASYVGVS